VIAKASSSRGRLSIASNTSFTLEKREVGKSAGDGAVEGAVIVD
jgi:hypothetical protein